MTGFRWMLCLLALSVGRGIEASEWIVRSIDTCDASGNVEVMVDAYDGVTVGYAHTVPAGLGDVGIARIGAAEKLFSRKKDVDGGSTASFAMDDYANVFWSASSSSTPSFRVGQDMGGLGGMISSENPFFNELALGTTPTMAVGPAGLPVMAGVDSGGFGFLSRFDPLTATWQYQQLDQLGQIKQPSSGPFPQSLSFDSDGNTLLAYVEESSQAVAVMRQGISGWETLARESAEDDYGRSLAGGPDGVVGLAYVDTTSRLVYGNSTGGGFAVEEIASSAGYISLRSLAYSPTSGQPSLVYSDISPQPGYGPLYLATRGTDGTWTNELLPVSVRGASLAFDSSGNAVIAAITDDSVVLIGQNIPRLIRGDANLDGTVDAQDAAALASNWQVGSGAGWADGDFNGDGKVNDIDATIIAANWTAIGDANVDGVVNDIDAAILADNWQTLTGATWRMGDFNGDGAVNDIDATIMAANWQPSAGQNTSVPEPGGMALLLSALVGFFLCNRSRADRKRAA